MQGLDESQTPRNSQNSRNSQESLSVLLVALPCPDERHPVGPEMRFEVELALESLPAHFALQAGPFPLLRGVPLDVPLGIPLGIPGVLRLGPSPFLLVGDEAVPAQGAGGGEGQAAVPALLRAAVPAVLQDMRLQLRPRGRLRAAFPAAQAAAPLGGGGAVGLLPAGILRGWFALAARRL